MEMHPKLLAAADMCESGEEVNLDELAFLLRYAADELSEEPKAKGERDRLIKTMRDRLLARCELLHRSEADKDLARDGDLEQLEALDQNLDRELRERYLGVQPETREEQTDDEEALEAVEQYRSGR